ncbi:TipAS antibiotic-recognition domain-containing protein [Streptomyces sp. CRN 30]|uniref:TipAS antibiotic-recognition domain-containing protein n=1 Tax=Streptomyces sp. CRN 30 TaxID=3075613 RepID=UPI0039C09A3A
MEAGEPPSGEAAMALAEEHRQQITGWFYDCPYAMHVCLAEHLARAITANAARHTG